MAYSLVSWIIVMIAVSWAAPQIDQYLMEHTSVYERIAERCEETVRGQAKGRLEAEAAGQANELQELGAGVPDAVLEGIMEKTAGFADGFLEESGVYEQMAAGMADFLVEGISFLIALVFARLLIQIISQILGIVSHIPILKGINRTLGLAAGGIYGLLIIWIAFYVIALCSTGETGRAIVSYIYESSFLTFLYEHNLVLTLLLHLF